MSTRLKACGLGLALAGLGTLTFSAQAADGPASITPNTPASQTVLEGTPATFTVGVDGTTPFTYQWLRNGAPIANANADTYTLTTTTFADDGAVFSVRVTNPLGNALSSGALLTIDPGILSTQKTVLFAYNKSWKYDQSGADLGTDWKETNFLDTAWASGSGLFGVKLPSQNYSPETIRTPWLLTNAGATSQTITYYCRTFFTLPASFVGANLNTSNLLDDGAVIYLNGVEAGRIRVADTPVTYQSLATPTPVKGIPDLLTLDNSSLVVGTNLIAVEVHQSSTTSPDVVFGMRMDALKISRLQDTNRPTLLSVFAIASNQVQVVYSERVEPASATNTDNYSIATGVTVLGAAFGGDASNIVLTTTLLAPGSNYVLSVTNVRDRAVSPNTVAANTRAGFGISRLDFAAQDVGGAKPAGSTTAVPGGYDLTGGGQDIGGSADQFQFNYQLRSGNFDVKVRVAGLTPTDVWAKAGLLARETIGTNNGRFAGTFATPLLSGSYFSVRAAPAAQATNSGFLPVNYPDTWLRLQRVGNVFTGYAGYDGNTWTLLGSATVTMSNLLFVGEALSSHDTNETTTAQFREYMDVTGGTVGNIALSHEPIGPSSRRTPMVISEIMFHPDLGNATKQLEYIEIFNTQPFFEDIGGWRISGDVDFTFPTNFVIEAGGVIVIARNPADVKSVYGINNVVGPYSGTNTLSNKSGTVRLRNELGAVLLEVTYDTQPPWPVAADGTGHSLVLARPSYGEADPRAWAASDVIGGSPGRIEGFAVDPLHNVVINEFFAHSQFPDLDFIELYNHSSQSVDISGAYLADNPAFTNLFRIPDGKVLPPGGFISFDETEMGFALNASGETIYLLNPSKTRVIDVVRYAGQALGVSSGRSPDGATTIRELSSRTPHAANSAPLQRDVVINEIMYSPVSGNDDDQFVELYNKGANPVNVGGWSFTSGISYNFPANTIIPVDGYLVVSRNKTRMMTNYPGLNAAITFGNFKGKLSHNSERVALSMPVTIVTTNGITAVTNTYFAAVNEVTYDSGGRWGTWAHGGGSSLELIDPHSDNQHPSNWADSDETQKSKSKWITVEATGPMAWGDGYPPDTLQLILQGAGECLVDNVEVISPAGTNIIANSTFENGVTGWIFQGTHNKSGLESGEGYQSSQSLHVRTSFRGDTGANRIQVPLTPVLNRPARADLSKIVTLRAKVRWLAGNPEILLKIHGNDMEATGRMNLPTNLGTPGAPNSRRVANAGPAIVEITHAPVLPAASQPVVVTARALDVDGLASFTLFYRLDPSASYTQVAMVDDGTGGDAVAGDGLYSGTIPGQTNGAMVAFYLQATDKGAPAATTRFPNDAPTRECLVRFGEPTPSGNLGNYHMWITAATVNTWNAREHNSNDPLDATFAYNNSRVVYNLHTLYSGSPWHTFSYGGPVGPVCDYVMNFPADDKMLGVTDFVLASLGNLNNDGQCQVEQASYWIARKVGLPWTYRRYVNMFVNGSRRAAPQLMEDCQQPNGDYVSEYFPTDSGGQLYKIEDWFEFDNGLDPNKNGSPGNVDATLENFTVNGEKRMARYRWCFRPRGVGVNGSPNDFAYVFQAADAINAAAPEPFSSALPEIIDVDQWLHTVAVEHIFGNWDSYGYRRGKNMFTYKPTQGPLRLLLWDIDFTLGSGGDGSSQDLFDSTEPMIKRMITFPLFQRAYWRAFKEAANGPLLNANFDPQVNAKYQALLADGIAVTAPDGMKGFVAARRAFILSLLPNVAFSVNGTNNYSTSNNLITITGNAPVDIAYFLVNGVRRPVNFAFADPVTKLNPTRWTLQLQADAGTNTINLQAIDRFGNPFTNTTVTVNYTGIVPDPRGAIVINEILYRPTVPESGFVELFNNSNYAFDISGWRLDGLDFTFPSGTIITNRQYLAVVENPAVFAATFGTSIPVGGQYFSNLDPNRMTLALVKPGATPEQDIVISKVRYEAAAPWADGPATFGTSLQLIDAAQDNARVSNWQGEPGWTFITRTANLGNGTNLIVYLTAPGTTYIDDISLVGPGGTNALQNGGFEDALAPAWIVPANYSASVIVSNISHSGNNSLFVVGTGAGGNQTTSIKQDILGIVASNTTYTLSFWALSNTNSVNLNVKAYPASLATNTLTKKIAASPAAANAFTTTLPPYPLLWLNEVLASNVTGITDTNRQHEPWIELYNSGTTNLSLDSYYLADNYTGLLQWSFPAGAVIEPGQYRIVFADDQAAQTTPYEWHTNFRLNSGGGSVALSRLVDGAPQILDYLNYGALPADHSFGSCPDGQLFDRGELATPTPGAANHCNTGPEPVAVFINEWMASNTNNLADPADGKFDDWFELYNAGTSTVDLAGYFLTDNLANKTQYQIPPGYAIPAKGHLLVWADNQTNENSAAQADLHVNFQLAKSGEAIGLYAPDGVTLVDSVTFLAQTNDVSQGRCPDGAANLVFFTTPTPRTANCPPAGPSFGSITPAGNGAISLVFGTLNGRSYRVEYKNDLNDSHWTPLGGDRPGTGANLTVTDNTIGAQPQRFYRIVLLN